MQQENTRNERYNLAIVSRARLQKKGFKLYSIVLYGSSGECARKVCGKAKRNQNIIMDYLKNPVIEVY